MGSLSLTLLGDLLIDLNTVCAVAPIQGTLEDGLGFHIVTTGGVVEVMHEETIEAVRQHFYAREALDTLRR
jgi:hypothetical protein